MRQSRVFQNRPLNINECITLDAFASHYLGRALLMRVDDPLILFNGEGGEYRARIVAINKKSVEVEILEYLDRTVEPPVNIHLGQVVSRGDKMDTSIQKAVELGVTEITPILSERCDVKLNKERWQKRLDHWQGVIISACEQSGRTLLPELNPVTDINDWVQNSASELKIILHPREAKAPNSKEVPKSIDLLVGSEGGFTDNELKLASEFQFKTIQLGPRVLRTETAGLVAISILQHLFGDL